MKTSLVLCLIFFISLWSNSATAQSKDQALIQKVSINGRSGKYSFAITIKSPDKGCNQYADWWEVLTEEGTLIYRRILVHSHVTEQPFTRNGGPVNVSADQVVLIRAHMNNTGYGSQIIKGSVKQGFSTIDVPEDFAEDLEKTEPLPSACAF